MNRRRGITLIELLIVVAIVSLLSAATLAMVVVPMREAKLADSETSSVVALSAAFPALVADAHGALRAERTDTGVRFVPAAGDPAEWSLGADAVLRRHAGDGAAVALAERVRGFEATVGADRVSLAITLDTAHDAHAIAHRRDVTLSLANGGQP